MTNKATICQSRSWLFLSGTKEGQRQCVDTNRSGGSSGRSGAVGAPPLVSAGADSGIRQRELFALKWSDLNVKERMLTIAEKRSVERREMVEYGDETRTISLTQEAVELLYLEHANHPSSPLMFMYPATQKLLVSDGAPAAQ